MLSPGTLFSSRYEIQAAIGRGSMGQVFRVHDILEDRLVALKWIGGGASSIASTQPDHEADVTRLAITNEFTTLARLRHPHIITVLDYGFQEGQPFFTMEYLAAAQDILSAARKSAQPLALVLQVLEALRYLHRQDIIHRDLKPSNVLVQAEHIKVLDFGLAAPPDLDVNGLVGSLMYMAPEVIRHETIMPTSDLYAVGMLAYQMLALRHPFDVSTASRLLDDTLNQPAPMAPIIQAAGEAVSAVIGRLLAKQPEDRFQDAQTAIEALCEAARLPAPTPEHALRDGYLRSAVFIGRTSERLRLHYLLSCAGRGRGGAVILSGEAGIGKTRLLDEMGIQGLVRGMQVLRTPTSHAADAPRTLWEDLLPPLLLNTPPLSMEASALQPLLPNIERLLGRSVPPPPAPSAGDGIDLQRRTLINLLRRSPQPVLMLIDDLHKHESGFPLLREIARAAGHLRLMLIGAFRSDDNRLLFSQFPDMQPMALGRFETEELTGLVASILGPAAARPDIIALLERETEGNPLFAVELLRALAAEAGGPEAIAGMALPTALFVGRMAELLNHRLTRLPFDDQPILRLAAVMGRVLQLETLRLIDDEMDWPGWLRRCEAALVLEQRPDGGWQFTHGKVRQALLSRVDVAELLRLDRIAQELRTAYAGSPAPV